MTQKERDYVTVGSCIHKIFTPDARRDMNIFLESGKVFCKKYQLDAHTTAKKLNGIYDANIACALIEEASAIHTKFTTNPIWDTNASCSLKFYPANLDYSKEAFYVADASYQLGDFAVIDCLESYSEGAGATLLNKIMNKLSLPIIIQAGFLHVGDYENYYATEDFSQVAKLVELCKTLGFRDVNHVIGQYEESVIMLYPGKASNVDMRLF